MSSTTLSPGFILADGTWWELGWEPSPAGGEPIKLAPNHFQQVMAEADKAGLSALPDWDMSPEAGFPATKKKRATKAKKTDEKGEGGEEEEEVVKGTKRKRKSKKEEEKKVETVVSGMDSGVEEMAVAAVVPRKLSGRQRKTVVREGMVETPVLGSAEPPADG